MLTKRVIPTIFATDKNTFEQKLRKVIYARNVHIDFMDGKFTDMKSVPFSDMEAIKTCYSITFQAHLMAKNPAKYIPDLRNLGIKEVLIQYESFKSKGELVDAIDEFKKNKMTVYLVINPMTNPLVCVNASHEIDGVMLMAVNPGREGQSFMERTYNTLQILRDNLPDMDILVDGGVKDKNVRKIIRSGASGVCVGSYISSSDTPKDNYDKLLYLIK